MTPFAPLAPAPRVLVIGAGPAGLTAAITLARAGVRCLVVDRRQGPSRQPRATVVSVRTMELFRSWGLADAVLAGGDEVDWQMLLVPSLAEAAVGEAVDVGYPTRAQAALVSPVSPGCVPQDHLESVLRDHLRTLPAAELWTGTTVENVRNEYAGVAVDVLETETGRRTTVRAEYVIGADGAHSIVRTSLGVDRRSTGRLTEALSVILRAPLWSLVGEHRYGIYAVTSPVAPATFLPAGHGDRWVFSIVWDPHAEQLADYPTARLVSMIRAAAGRPDLPVAIDGVGSFGFVASVADRFRVGRVVLVGDAAHQVTPRGGTGMNTAIADGYDVGWKLSWVLNGWAGDSLLDSYETERRPVAEHNVARSIDPLGSRRAVGYELGVDLGGRLPHVWLPGTTTSTLDLLGPGLTLLTSDGASEAPVSPTRATASQPVPLEVRHLDPVTARAVGIHSSSLLLRPDGVPYRPETPDLTSYPLLGLEAFV